MSFIQAIVLLMIKKISGQRTASSVYHLLKGKKSSQTLQDAHLFELDKWFHTAPFLERNQFERWIHDFTEKGWIIQKEQVVYLTDCGDKQLSKWKDILPPLQFVRGLQLQGCAQIFWKRLTLLVQVASHLISQQTRYLPVTRDETIHGWLKVFLRQQGLLKQQLASKLYQELSSSLKSQTAEDPLIAVLRLSGSKRTGKTASQAAAVLKLEETEYWYRFLNLLHFLIQHIIQRSSQLPLLFAMIEDIYQPVVLTHSARRTAELLRRGYSPEEIAAKRRLKMSTVEDHLVELALNLPEFSISPFVSEEAAAAIVETASGQMHKKLKPIKDQHPNVTYFQIRLVLAKYSR
ncbi:helix-turn-helix domain-containing protein [Bacillus xiapuensis]|uniref:helix-turn-helix domain-containing protein n=1 Tax=Bacillus xiapuensis TaxID=2014075 RepID=UPI000C247479|nr:helix-turn-helix domain-containing protein [Bacillus xiapuensis]